MLKQGKKKPFFTALVLGVVAGMRTFSAPAIASHILSQQNSGHLAKSPLNFMQSENVSTGLKVLALGEFVGDKLPTAPNRTEPLGITGRCLAGSLAGASIYKASGNSALQGALVGGIVALGATFGSYLLRKTIVEKLNVNDPYIGGAEDILVLAAGAGLIAAS